MDVHAVDNASLLYDSARILYLNQQNWPAYLQALSHSVKEKVNKRDFEGALNELLAAKANLPDSLPPTMPLEEFYSSMGQCHFYLSHADSALYYYQKALLVSLIIRDESYGKAFEIYEGLGNVHRFLNHDYSSALSYYGQANALLDKMAISDKKKELEFHCYYNLATTNRVLKNTEKALYYGSEAVRLAGELNYIENLQMARGMLANIYDSQQEYDKSISINEDIIRTYEDSSKFDLTNDKYNEDLYLNGLRNLGLALAKAGKLSASKNIYQKILTHGAMAPDFLADIYGDLGYLYSLKEEHNRAEYYLEKHLTIVKKLYGEKDQNTAKAYGYFAKLYGIERDWEMAIKYDHLALVSAIGDFNSQQITSSPAITQSESSYLIYELLREKSYYLFLKYQSDPNKDISLIRLSLHTYLLAERIMKNKRDKEILESDELGLARSEQDYSFAAMNDIYILMASNPADTLVDVAFDLMNQNKARILLKAMHEAEAMHDTGMPDSLITKRNDLNQQLAYWQHQQSLNLEDTETQNQAREKIFRVIDAQSRLSRYLEQHYPSYYKSRYNKDTLNLQQVVQLSRGKKALFIQYGYYDSLVYTLGIWQGKKKLFRFAVDTLFSQALTKYRQVLETPDYFSKAQFQAFEGSSFSLYKKLLEPVFGQFNISPNDSCQLIVIPDEPLNTIPFEALITKPYQGQRIDYRGLPFLIKQHSVQYSYSAEFLFHKQRLIDRRNVTFGGWGYDELENGNVKLEATTLNASKKELSGIAQDFHGKTFWKEVATETSFKENLKDFNILHLSIHGAASTANDTDAALFFFPDKQNDGTLHPYELYKYQTSANLTVLSACETGVGVLHVGEGIYSIARAFFYMGCPSVVMSLWNVKDQTGQKIMDMFYKNLNKGDAVDQSLRLAKLRFIQQADEITAHPSSWASLVSIGQPEAFVMRSALP